MTSQHRANYYGNNLTKVPSIKYLSNEPTVQITSCDRLEAPNFLTGIAAAIINVCIALKKPALSYICYKGTLEIDINAIKEFYNVLSKSSQNIYIVSCFVKEFLIRKKK